MNRRIKNSAPSRRESSVLSNQNGPDTPLMRRFQDASTDRVGGFSPAVANMAIDAALLETFVAGDPPILRFYRWPEPTLSLGYFQAIEQRNQHEASTDLEIVRRSSGGGAIIHHNEWTYSLIMPNDRVDRAEDPTDWLYRLVHGCFCESLGEQGISSRPHGQSDRCDGICDAFLCFQRRSQYDLIVSGYKVLGSAQRKGRHARLQHGSLILKASEFAPQLPGIAELTGKSLDQDRFVESVSSKLATALDCQMVDHDGFDDAVFAAALGSAESKFGNRRWVHRR